MLFVLAWFAVVWWTLLLIQELLNLIVLPSLDPQGKPSDSPFVSIVVPARNEEAIVERAARGFLAQDYPRFEVIIVDDRSEDGTGAILERLRAEDERLIVLPGTDLPRGWLGKPWALHQGAAAARGQLLLFADADVLYEPSVLSAAVAHFQRGGAGLLSLFPRIEMRGFWENLSMPGLAMAGLVWMPVWLSMRSRDPHLALGGGPGNLLTRRLYGEIGGHEALRNAVVDDVGLARLVRRHGLHTAIVRADDLVSIRMYRGFREMIEGFTKNTFTVLGHRLSAAMTMLMFSLIVDLLPFVMAAVAVFQWAGGKALSSAAVAGLGAVLLITLVRLILFSALRYRMDSALLGHPLMSIGFLYVLARSAWQLSVRGELKWRGRTYTADSVTFGGETRR